MTSTHRELSRSRYSKAGLAPASGWIALEIETMLYVNGEDWLSFRCSPDELESLAAGFLFNQRIIRSRDEISSISLSKNMQTIDVWLTHDAPKPQTWNRTSGCNAGLSSINSLAGLGVLSQDPIHISQARNAVDLLQSELRSSASQMNGVHTTVLVKDRQLVSSCLDIGRHNTLDKIAGDCLLRGISPRDCSLATTGRITLDMVFKAVKMGVPLLISFHSASAPALDAARESGMVLVSHARAVQMDFLTGTERMIFSD